MTRLITPTAAETRQLAPAPRVGLAERSATMFRRGEAAAHAERMRQIVGPADQLPKPTGYLILVAQFVTPDKTAGGIELAQVTKKEDRWQGNVGLVLALGPEAYQPDAHRKFAGPWCKQDDWVIFAVTNESGRRFRWQGVCDCFLLIDDHIMAVVGDPVDVR